MSHATTFRSAYGSIGVSLRLAGALLVAGLLGAGCQKSDTDGAAEHPSDTAAAVAAPASAVERGKYIVTISGCNDCHTPLKMGANGPEPDMSLMLSGHPAAMQLAVPAKAPEGGWMWLGAATNTAFFGPWGITYAVNLTPDSLTGIGTWSEEMFIKTLRSGKHWGTSRPIMPPMPWQGIAQMTDEDLKAMYAFLRSLPPISNKVPEYMPPAAPTAHAAPADSTHM